MASPLIPSLVLYRDRPQTPINGVGRLPAAMTINGTTEHPVFRYTAGAGLVDAADWRPWGYGENLDIVAVATPPTLADGSPGLGPMDQSVKFAASDYFAANNNTFADITTEDMVIEAVVRHSGVSTERILDKRDTLTRGWILYQSNATVISVFVQVAAGPSASINSPALTANCFYHIICFLDRSGSGIMYVDGSPGSATTISGLTATWTVAAPFCIGGRGSGADPFSSNIAYAAMWKGAAWLDTHLQATIAEQRASLFWGWRPNHAGGTAVPTARTRASNAYLDRLHHDGTRRLYLVGQNVPRCVERVDKNGATIKGYLAEVQITNGFPNSEAFGSWTLDDLTSVTSDGETSPNGLTTSDGLIPNANNTTHGVRLSVTLTATTAVVSVFCKPGNKNWLCINNTTLNYRANFDVTNGVIGTTNGIIAAGVERFGNGFYRCWMSFTATAASHTLRLRICDGDDGQTFIGDATNNALWLFGAQVEQGVAYPTSYMPTAAAAVIREEDSLRYKGDDGNLGGVGSNRRFDMKAKVLFGDYDAVSNQSIVSLTDGSLTTDGTLIRVSPTGDVLNVYADSAESDPVNVFATTDVVDDAIHEVEVKFKPLDLALLTDGSEEGAGSATAIPADEQDRIDVGQASSVIAQANGVLADIELYPRETRS